MPIDDQGYQVLPAVFDRSTCQRFTEQIEAAMAADQVAGIGSRQGWVGGRNLLEQWDGWKRILRSELLIPFVHQHCGRGAGLVRILYFDKPPGGGWSLSLHRDRTIAVAAHRDPAQPFSKPTRKAGVPHVQATTELLSRMLTLRLHLDAMTDQNGPLIVVAGSHTQLDADRHAEPAVIRCEQGDVFAMRPLILHGSRPADPDTQQHRRVIHLEFAPEQTLPGGYCWHQFFPVG